MKSLMLPLVLAFASITREVSGKSIPQAPLGLQVHQYEAFLSMLVAPGQSTTEGLSDFLMSTLSDSQREDLMLKLWEQHDVVDVMKMTGNGEGLDDERLVHVFGEDSPRIMTEGEKLRLKKNGYSFMDITEHPELEQLNVQSAAVNVVPLSVGVTEHTKSLINSMAGDLDDQHLRADLAKLSSFWNRNYRSPWGLLSSNWIFDQALAILESADKDQVTTSISKFHHKFFQNSVIARIESKDSSVKDKETIILSAHQDSLNYKLPFYRAPGSDDDGSGSVTILQVLRSLVEQTFILPPHIAIEFHWFAGEEGGLLGSQDVAAAYKKAGNKVKGMLHMDMTAFVRNGTQPIIGFFESNVDANLTTFATKLVDEYIPLKWNMTGCGSVCGSDHMSFNKVGYPVAFANEALFENAPHEFIHTANDNMDQDGQFSFDHMLQFVKLGIAFAVELAAQQ